MATYYRVPTISRYLPFLVVAPVLLALFPYLVCLDFSTPEFEPVCPVSWQARTGQSGALLMYFSAVLAVLSLYWQNKVDRNLLTAETEISHLGRVQRRYSRVLERTGTHTQALREIESQLEAAHQEKANAVAFPRLVKLAGWWALGFTFLGTLMQVLETGA